MEDVMLSCLKLQKEEVKVTNTLPYRKPLSTTEI